MANGKIDAILVYSGITQRMEAPSVSSQAFVCRIITIGKFTGVSTTLH